MDFLSHNKEKRTGLNPSSLWYTEQQSLLVKDLCICGWWETHWHSILWEITSEFKNCESKWFLSLYTRL